MHVLEPADLWQRYIDKKFTHRAPIGCTDHVRDLRLVGPDGCAWGRPDDPPAGTLPPPGHIFHKNQKLFKTHNQRGWSAQVQLDAMSEEGIDLAILYPSRGLNVLTIPNLEAEFAAALARAYNDWLFDFCQADKSKLVGAGMISPFDIADAISEARRCVEQLGFRAIFLRANIVNGHNWHEPYYEPLWSALEELDVPLGFHEANNSAARQVGDNFGYDFMLRHTYAHPVEQMLAVGAFCGGGILARHPKLRVAFLEGNCGWLPFLLWRLDEHWELYGDQWAPSLEMAPSHFFKRQCYASVECDEEPAKYAIDYLGNERLVFSTDFPHVDTKYPKAVERFLELPLSDDDKRKILWD
ncbi:MAG TPA: amidohydrolase family protein, partial [Candidatus Binatus sp.]|nr:amidohydrolase family protein [Candidatus Binatus sp.]